MAIQTAITYAQYTKAKIHIHHVTSFDGAQLIAEAKRKGINITAETCPHYLLLDANKTVQKVYPPIRDEWHRKCLWDALSRGTIDMLATDHAPHTAEEKARPLWEMPAGLTGVETFVPLMLNEVNKGTLTLNEFVRYASETPAKIWNIFPRKGSLQPGADADFTIIDMNAKKTIKKNELHSKSKTSPFDKTEVQGIPVATVLRGKFMMKDDKLTGEKGFGSLVSPAG
jgi:dihydroorotase (multifunctional complex type)